MGQITIEVPQKVNRKYRIVSESAADEIMLKVEKIVKKANKIDDEILGLWSDRDETVKEIAHNLRKKTNDRSLKND